MEKKKIFAFLSVFLEFLLIFNFAFAWEVEWPEIPGTEFTKGDKCPTTGCPPENLSDFVVYFFNLALVIAGFVTFVMIIIAGVQYMLLAVESPAAAQSALSRIKNSLLALILLFGAFLILNAINPEILVPGLEKLAISGTPLGEMSVFDREVNDGIKICRDDRCEDCIQLLSSEADLPNTFENYDPLQFNYFQILDPGLLVEFYAQPNFKGEMTFAEGTTVCTHFSQLPHPDVSGKVHSVRLVTEAKESFYSVVCRTEKPTSEDKCLPFPLNTGEGQREVKIKYGSPNNHEIRLTSKAIHDLSGNEYTPIKDNEAKWMSVPGGSVAILCKKVSTGAKYVEGEYCYFILETTPLKYYGDGADLTDPEPQELDKTTSLIFFKGADELDVFASLNDKDPCKGVIFYIGPAYNRIYDPPPGFPSDRPEAAAFPLGMGNLDLNDTVNLEEDPVEDKEYYTRIDDLGGHLEIIVGDQLACGAGKCYQISAVKLIGNCKLKICDDTNLGGTCDVLDANFYPKLSNLCRPMDCYATCTAPGSPGETVSCTASCAGVPASCGGGPSCNCSCKVPAGQTSCTCACCCTNNKTWDNAIKSFILCNKENDKAPCDF